MNGTVIKKKMFKTGSLRILPRSMIDVFEHNIEDKELLEWLQNFDLDKTKDTSKICNECLVQIICRNGCP